VGQSLFAAAQHNLVGPDDDLIEQQSDIAAEKCRVRPE